MKDWVVPFPKFGAGIGLHRVSAIAGMLGVNFYPQRERACVITGSNGKGSVAAMTAAGLQAGKLGSVGLFTSPHLFSIHERFSIDGVDITDDELERCWRDVEAVCRGYERLRPDDLVGGFEFLFVVAAKWFRDRGCKFVVWEAGIGGRYDPTRNVHAMQGALVSLDLEHTALLGNTLELIAYDKLDAFPPGASVLLGETCRPLMQRLVRYADLKQIKISRATWERASAENAIVVEAQGAPTREMPVALAGTHQHNNAAIAFQLARAMLAKAGHDPRAAADAAAQAGSAVRWPGRLEQISDTPPVVIDVGHTPDAIRLAREGFEARYPPCVLVCGASVDKSADEIVSRLAPGFLVIIACAAAHKGAPADDIACVARAANPKAEVIVARAVREAHDIALARAARMSGSVYVAGGLFVATEFKAAHLGVDPATLRFF